MKETLRENSNMQILKKEMKDACAKQLFAGMSTVPTLKALQNLRTEMLGANDRDANDCLDVVKRSMEEEQKLFIRSVKLPKLTVINIINFDLHL